MDKPYFSIIVVSFNAEKYIEKTLFSILNQKFQDYEIIVKDACSKDDTLKKIPQDNRIRIYCTKDNGIYDGMNEAIEYVQGQYCTFLNCGDTFFDENVLKKVYDVISKKEANNTIFYGDCYRENIYVKQPSKLTDFYLYKTPLNHQSMFFCVELFSRLGNYNTNLKIAADYEFTIRAFKSGVDFIYASIVVCNYLGGGLSESEKGKEIKKGDYAYIHDTHFTEKEKRKFNLLLALSMKKFRQKIASSKSPKWVRKLYRKVVNLVNR